MVLTPLGRGGPRLSIDYSRIFIGNQIAGFPIGASELVTSRESDFPERVIRLPLTDEDRALGFTGGPISMLDLRAVNSGSTIIHSVDLQFNWSIADIFGGVLSPYASATWQPSVRTRPNSDWSWLERVGYRDGPLAWRGNGGFTWKKGRTGIDLNVQFYDGYRIFSSNPLIPATDALWESFQGSDRIPPQVYLDLAVSRRFTLRGNGLVRSIDARFGIQNLLDHRPPIIGFPDSTGYSGYGDPRRRRFELSLSLHH